MPASAVPAVSANIPSLPEIFRSLELIVIFPPAAVLVAPFNAVALIEASLPMVTVGELISMLPAAPALLVSAEMAIPSVRVRFWASILISPALPVPVVSTEIFPSPVISMFSGANILMLPP